ncbi:MAG: PD40 domain-containing protein [Deltaproteobacteria bacterium]|nr:PD40 domain-containing protein [Deltaproteobacteria bacterium]
MLIACGVWAHGGPQCREGGCKLEFGAKSARAAGAYDPDVPYSTLRTPHFLVMYAEGYGRIALRAAEIGEASWSYLAARYAWTPNGRINIIINDQTDSANGSATILPSKTITLFVTAPTRVSGLEDYDDWLSAVLIHELAHIYHLDMAYGLPWLGRQLLGKYVAMNQYVPAWLTEGLAVYEETVSTGGGRGRSAYVDMVLRTAALNDVFPSIDQGYRGYPNWPFSNIAYFFGGRFQLYLAGRFGEDALLEYHRKYAANPIPYITYLPSKLVFQESMPSLWSAFEDDEKAKAEAMLLQIRTSTSLPLTTPKRITFHGGECVGPRVTPDGRSIVFSASSPVDGARVRRIDIDGSGEEILLDDTLSLGVSFTSDGRAFYLQQAEINQRYYAHNNLYRFDLERKSLEAVSVDPLEVSDWVASSGSLRAREPDVSPDGRRLVFVQSPFGANRLVLAWVESDGRTIHPRVIVPAEPDVQLSNPRFSPDGTAIAVARFRAGRRDIVVYDLTGAITYEVTRDRSQDTDPTWSPDGRWIVFSSDRSGIYNLYAFDTHDQTMRQLTNLITGAFQPSITPDAQTIIYRGYGPDGFDVYSVPFAPADAPRVPYTKAPLTSTVDTTPRRWPPPNEGAPEIPPPAPFRTDLAADDLPEGWSTSSYSALDTILPFNDNWNLFPALIANEHEIYGSLSHFGADAMGTQSYALNVNYGTLTEAFGGSASYAYDGLEPTIVVSGTSQAVTFSRRVVVEQSGTMPCAYGGSGSLQSDGSALCYGPDQGQYDQRRNTARISLGLPFRQRHRISLGYAFERRSSLDALPPDTIERLLPRSGNFARITLGYTYADTRSFPYSISAERGPSFGIALEALSKGLGSDYEAFVLTSEGRYYLSMPWRGFLLSNHVLALRLGIGFTLGPDLAETFRLGGATGRSAVTTTTDDFYPLRGLETSALDGTAVIAGSAEYRAPLIRIDRGLWTMPVTFQVLHAAVFVDSGRVFDALSWEKLRRGFQDEWAVGVGGELRADFIFFYELPLTLRVGYARAVRTPASMPATSQRNGFYFELGTLY